MLINGKVPEEIKGKMVMDFNKQFAESINIAIV